MAQKRQVSADIDVLDDHTLKVITAYDPDFVDELKREVPHSKRSWHGKPDNFWAVDVSYLDLLVRICEKHFAQVRLLFDHGMDDPFATLFLYPEAPKEVVQAVYKALAKLYHPDVNGGDGSKMSALNTAYAEIKTAKGW